jgi:hypothetical protein
MFEVRSVSARERETGTRHPSIMVLAGNFRDVAPAGRRLKDPTALLQPSTHPFWLLVPCERNQIVTCEVKSCRSEIRRLETAVVAVR